MAPNETVGELPAEHFIPQGTRDNYDQIARDAAKVNGTTAKESMAVMAEQFAKQHLDEPLAGYDHLAAWARDRDLDDADVADPAAAAKSRAIESARRDPSTALAGDPDVAAAALEGAQAQADAAANVARVDVEGGVIPNTGRIPVDTSTAGEPATSDEPEPVKPGPKPAKSGPAESGS